MTSSRFVKSAIKTAKEDYTTLPWTRGARRRAFIIKRSASQRRLKTA